MAVPLERDQIYSIKRRFPSFSGKAGFRADGVGWKLGGEQPEGHRPMVQAFNSWPLGLSRHFVDSFLAPKGHGGQQW